MKTQHLLASLLLLFVIGFTSCGTDTVEKPSGAFSNGVFIINEGPFMSGTGTITFYKQDSNLVKQDIFEAVNKRPLGNVAQSMAVFNGQAYLVANNAKKVEVVDAATFKSAATITGFSGPRYFLGISSQKAYVSDWSGNVQVVDLTTHKIAKAIATGKGPENMLKVGNNVVVANSGGFENDKTLTVIDVTTEKTTTLTVGDNPTSMAIDAQNKLWVLCRGINNWADPSKSTAGSIVKIDPVNWTIEKNIPFSNITAHPERLIINKEKTKLFFLLGDGIYSFDIANTAAAPVKLVSQYFYSLGYENKTGYLYAGDAKDFVSNGTVVRYKTTGEKVDQINAGIIPGNYCFATE